MVYKNLKLLRIKKEDVERFDEWFKRNGPFAIFIARLIPLVRGLISFPAGFARMDLKKFYLYSLAGSLIWNVALIEFGYYALSVNSFDITATLFALLAIALYVIYKVALRKIGKKG
ncbi:MAG: VTT domain-containing protein [Candidatus Micrarchaeota archaeon]|nr:VTT domain-containing protein [Candidatus Micrarchaeota archaeon]